MCCSTALTTSLREVSSAVDRYLVAVSKKRIAYFWLCVRVGGEMGLITSDEICWLLTCVCDVRLCGDGRRLEAWNALHVKISGPLDNVARIVGKSRFFAMMRNARGWAWPSLRCQVCISLLRSVFWPCGVYLNVIQMCRRGGCTG